MVDPRVVLVILAIAASVWAGAWVVHGVKIGAHVVRCGIAKVIHHPCTAPYTPPPPPVFDPGSIAVP